MQFLDAQAAPLGAARPLITVPAASHVRRPQLLPHPDGGYLRVVPCDVKLNQPHAVSVTAQGDEIVVGVDGRERIRYRDTFLPLTYRTSCGSTR